MVGVRGIEPGAPVIRRTTSVLTRADRWDHLLARWGVNRSGHRVEPGLYALGSPTPDAPVFVTANYTLSFDALRSALSGVDAYILVLDTYGVNVWCAAGKGTFGTDELVHRIHSSRLDDVVRHRKLILPQLGAPGVAAHEVRRRTRFKVEYSPVRAQDLPEYLRTGGATPEMRRVRFDLADRVVLIPVELVHVAPPMLLAAAAAFFLGGLLGSAAVVAAVLAGAALFPVLLPVLPTDEFSTKGFILGAAVALPIAAAAAVGGSGAEWWFRAVEALAYMTVLPPVTAYLALNFTGSTPFTSRTAVRREIFTYVPVMAWVFGVGIVLTLALTLIRVLGGA
jgi:hypothetical protein